MERRNQLLALSCLIVFVAFGVFYFRTWVVQKPFGIILFVAEGLDPARLAATRIYAGGAEVPLTMDSLPYTALLKNYSKDSATPDQAAAATALATGVKVKNGSLGVDPEGKALQNLFELARGSGRMTGLVTNALLTDPTSAGFYAHTSTPVDRSGLARTLVETSEIDIVMGGGAADFLPPRKDGRRSDERDLLLEIRGTGYDLVQTLEELEAVPRWRRAKMFGLFSRTELVASSAGEERGDQPTLSDMVRRSIELLQFNSDGYLLVVDAGLMGMAARTNNTENALAETMELDRAVSIAQRYAGAKSTIIVCGDVALGGLTLSGFSPLKLKGSEVLKTQPGENSRLRWATEPNNQLQPNEAVEIVAGNTSSSDGQSNEPPAKATNGSVNIAGDVIAFGSGFGAESLQGTLENTAIFEIIRDNL